MMSIRTQTLTVTVAGSAGSAAGSAVTPAPLDGRLVSVHVDYTTQPATCDVTIAVGAPSLTLLTLTNTNSDGWFHPRVLVDGVTGADLTAIYDTMPLFGYVTASVAQGDPGSVAVTLVYEG